MTALILTSQGNVMASAREASALSFQPMATRSQRFARHFGGSMSTGRPVCNRTASIACPTGERRTVPDLIRGLGTAMTIAQAAMANQDLIDMTKFLMPLRRGSILLVRLLVHRDAVLLTEVFELFS